MNDDTADFMTKVPSVCPHLMKTFCPSPSAQLTERTILRNPLYTTGDFIKKVPVCTRDRQIVHIERVNTQSTFYMKSAVDEKIKKGGIKWN